MSAACDRGCAPDDCQAICGGSPRWLRVMPDDELQALLAFANQVQAWSFAREGRTTFAEAAQHFAVSVEAISRAVIAHYWLFADDPSLPLAERCIEHEGE
jgi:hypothetical protein